MEQGLIGASFNEGGVEQADRFTVDPFGPKQSSLGSFFNAVLATALFRCWHILIFFTAWATAVSVISHNVYSLSIQPTLLTVVGTVLGFVISYRTTSSFERYNEGRRYWSQIVLSSRTFARTIWFHVPEVMPATPADQNLTVEEKKSRVIIEKKTVINLVEAFSVAVKHYLRGEDGIYYVDLYHLVKFLPAYAFPAGLPSAIDVTDMSNQQKSPVLDRTQNAADGVLSDRLSVMSQPHPSSPGGVSQRMTSSSVPHLPRQSAASAKKISLQLPTARSTRSLPRDPEKGTLDVLEDGFLLPARMPPKYHLFDFFPFSLLVRILTKKGKEVKGKKAARMRARMKKNDTHNLPLEISLYLSSYVAALQARKAIDPPTSTSLLNTVNQLVDALTGLERILTTPIPFSYSIHLWVVTVIYNLALPFQIWAPLKWLTIPATTIASFIFFGFLVCGEEIENPFGYDKNDLNMDHFTHNIIRHELRAITATPAPDPAHWAFSPANDLVFAMSHRWDEEERVTPEQWVKRGQTNMLNALSS